MKSILILMFVLLTITTFGQTNQTITLRWKVGEKEKLNYLTMMSDIDTSKFEINLGTISKFFSDSTGKGQNETRDLFKKLNQTFKNIDFVTTLTDKGNGIVDIVMTTRQKEEIKKNAEDTTNSKEATIIKMMQSMNQGVMLRGSVYATGGIHSFWVKNSQKNLISIFFELPKHPVKIGDTWPLDISLISNDQNFSCDSSYKLNEVKLTDIKNVNGKTIAILNYNIVEYVNGRFNSPILMGEGKQQPTIMKFIHYAIAEFSVDDGRWISYDGIMSIEATGVMTATKKTKFTLIKE